MKLNKQQIEALAREISNQILAQSKPLLDKERKAYDKERKTLTEKLEKDPLIKILRALPSKIPATQYNCNGLIGQIITDRLKDLTYTPSIIIPGISEIQSKIILKTIDCDNLDDIISSIKSSYIS